MEEMLYAQLHRPGPAASPMPLLASCTSLSKSYGSRTLFSNISLGISEGERLGLIGPNGAGKSTLLKILAGRLEPDSGAVSLRRNTRVGYVPQDAVFPEGKTAFEIVAEAIDDPHLNELERAARINQTLGRAGFSDGSALAGFAFRWLAAAPGGGARTGLRARRAVPRRTHQPSRPGGHSVAGKAARRRILRQRGGQPRPLFLDNVVNGMAEINRSYPEGIFRVEGGYEQFLERKEAFLLAQANRQEALANKVEREVEWLRRGPKARRGKSRARIDEAGRLIRELGDLRSR